MLTVTAVAWQCSIAHYTNVQVCWQGSVWCAEDQKFTSDCWRHHTCSGLPTAVYVFWGYRGGSPKFFVPLFRPGNPALCGRRPLVTPYYCRLGDLLILLYDLLCYTCMLYLSTILCVTVYACVFCVFFVLSVVFLYSFLLQYFDTVGWVFWP